MFVKNVTEKVNHLFLNILVFVIFNAVLWVFVMNFIGLLLEPNYCLLDGIKNDFFAGFVSNFLVF